MNDLSSGQNQVDAFELRVADRYFPHSEFSEAQPTDELNIDFRALLNRLGAVIRDSAMLDQNFDRAITFSELIPLYQSSLSKIGELQSDWYRLIDSLIHFEVDESVSRAASVILRQEHDKEKKNWLTQVRDDTELRPEPIKPIIEARMSTSPIEEVRTRLTDDLEAKCSNLALEVVSRLCRLVDLQVCGLVEWHGPNHCKYHYYSRFLKTSVDAERRTTLLNVNTTTENEWVQKIVTSGKHTKSLCRFVHHLTNAVKRAPGNATLPIPEDRMKIIKAIPNWLLPDVRLVEGTLFRSTTITQDLESSDWKNEQVDRVVFMRDPALILGPFVLTGWGPKDIQREVTRRGGSDLTLAGIDAMAAVSGLPKSMDHQVTEDTLLLIAGAAAATGTSMIYVGWANGFSSVFAIPGYIGIALSAWLFGVLAQKQVGKNSQVELLDIPGSSQAANRSPVSVPPHVGSTIAVGLLGAATTAFSQGNYLAFVVLATLSAFSGANFYGQHLSTLWETDPSASHRK